HASIRWMPRGTGGARSRRGCSPSLLWPLPACQFPCFFFQAEDGIRDLYVTGVQTCALPIWPVLPRRGARALVGEVPAGADRAGQIGRASCRERVEIAGGGVLVKKKKVCGGGGAVVVVERARRMVGGSGGGWVGSALRRVGGR